MKIQDITSLLETIAPVAYQETYDNSGLITGNPEWICTGVIISLDTTEDVVQEALAKKCNLIVSHHPIIFEGLKKITGKNYIERTIIAAIKNNIAIYAIHTNLDNVKDGVNKKIAEKLQLQHIEILQPAKSLLKKLITFAPVDKAAGVRQALFNAGGGSVGKYSECSFNTEGTGTFKAGEGTDPFVGEIGKQHQEKEIKIELIFQAYLERTIISALKEAHPYEVVAYDILTLGNSLSEVGSGITGELKNELGGKEMLQKLVLAFGLKTVKHTRLSGRSIKKVALCGGAGYFLLQAAIASDSDIFITSDIKYHQFFEADSKILLADMGHYESEQFTTELLFDILRENFPNFAVLKTGVNTNPVHYFG